MAATYSYATFFCGTCERPIRLDSSLLEHSSVEDGIDPILAERSLRSGLRTGHQSSLPPTATSSSATTSNVANNKSHHLSPPESLVIRYTQPNNNNIWRSSSTTNIQDSFVMLSRSQVVSSTNLNNGSQGMLSLNSPFTTVNPSNTEQRGNLSHRLKTAGKLFDLISGVSQVDHPLCQDCADELQIILEKRLSEVRKERDVYSVYLDKLNDEQEKNAEDHKRITEEDLEALKEREEQSLQVLKELEVEKGQLKEELEMLEAELQELDHLETCYWQDVNEYETELREFQGERDTIQMKQGHIDRQLQNLRRTNVINDTFRIWHDGPFGTINGFRLGRLPSILVDWSEINAALGQVLLLMDVLVNRLNFTFRTYRLVPMGSFSRIEKIEGDKASYELYGSGDIASVLFHNRRFDMALVALLNCLQQMCEVVDQDKVKIPYKINKDKIGDASIRHPNHDETWTKALKFVLINLKWVLAYACMASRG